RDGLAMEHALLSRPEAVVDEFAGHENDASRGLEGSSSQSSNDLIHYDGTSVTRSVGRQFGRPSFAAYRTKSNHTALECLHEDEETDADRRPQYRGKQHYKQRLRRHDTTPQQTNSARWPPPLERTDLTRAAGTSPLGADTYSGYSQTQNNAPPNCRIAPGLGGFFKDRLRRLQSAREISEIWFDFTNLIRRVQVVHYNPNPRPTPIPPFPEKSNRVD